MGALFVQNLDACGVISMSEISVIMLYVQLDETIWIEIEVDGFPLAEDDAITKANLIADTYYDNNNCLSGLSHGFLSTFIFSKDTTLQLPRSKSICDLT